MQVLATAGHVDHGKSTLVRALTGMEPDRLAAEQQRGMTIDLGYGWLTLGSGQQLAFVDVPGHERFIANMLAGVGAAPGVLLVVAADDGWSRQSEEHLAAIDALGICHGLLVITRSDVADPAPALSQARRRLARSSLAGVPAVAVSAVSGAGMPELISVLDDVVGRMPVSDPGADVRFWIDRSFTVKGRGTVVTGTLTAGRISVGDELVLAGRGSADLETVQVRGCESLKTSQDSVSATARLALNLRGADQLSTGRGSVLLSPGRWALTDTVDVRASGLRGGAVGLPGSAVGLPGGAVGLPGGAVGLPGGVAVMVHIGTAEVSARLRRLSEDTARLRLSRPLPLRIGDRVVLRDPTRHASLAGATMLDVRPPPLDRRGAARSRAEELAHMTGAADLDGELRRRRVIRGSELRAIGIAVERAPLVGDWHVDPTWWAQKSAELSALVAAHADPLGLSAAQAQQALGLSDKDIFGALVSITGSVSISAGRLMPVAGPPDLPAATRAALDQLLNDLEQDPFLAPEAGRLAELGLDRRTLASLTAGKHLTHVGAGVYLLPDAIERALTLLAGIEQPFTLSAARQALGTTRRVAVPLLELLDQRRLTVRDADSRRRMRS